MSATLSILLISQCHNTPFRKKVLSVVISSYNEEKKNKETRPVTFYKYHKVIEGLPWIEI